MLKRNIFANYVGAAWNAIMNIAFVPLYVTYLGTEAYGVIGISAIIGSFLAFLDLGLSPMLNREMARYRGGAHSVESIRSLLRTVELCSWSVGLLGVLLLWLTAPWIASNWLQSETIPAEAIAHALRIMAIVVCLRFVEGVYRGVLIGLQQQVTVNAIAALTATLKGLGSIAVLAWWSPTLDAFFWWQGAVASLGVSLFMAFGHRALPIAAVRLKHGVRILATTWPFARGILIGNLIGLGLTQADKVVLSRLLELSEYGQYVLVMSVASCIPVAAGPIGQAMYPRLTERYSAQDEAGLVTEFHRMAQLVTVVAAGLGLVLVAFADEIMLAWTGDLRIASAVTMPLRLLSAGSILFACAQVLDYLQLAAGCTRLRNGLNGIAMLAIVPALLLAVPRYGMNAAAAVWLVLNVTYICVYAPLSLRSTLPNEFWGWAVRDFGAPLFAAMLTCLAVRAACRPLPTHPIALATLMAITAALCMTTAAIAAPVVRTGALNTIRSVIGASRSRARGLPL